MADRRPRRRTGRSRGWLVVASFVALGVATPVAVLASTGGGAGPAKVEPAAPAPGQSCPDTTPAPGSSAPICVEVVQPAVNGGGGIDLAGLLPILAGAVVGGLVVLVAVFLFLSRRAAAPLAPADPGEWWTCRNCGKTNVVGSPRCYACGTWQA
jgi:hypothetical protein